MAQVIKKDGEQVVKKNLRYERDKDREKVRGIFRFNEIPGGSMSFVFKKYEKDPIEKYDFVDGGVYTIPLGVAKHLNNNCWYPIHAYAKDENDKSIMKIGEKVHRCSFQSLEFVDIEGLDQPANILTAEKV